MLNVIAIFIGGGIGSVLRYFAGLLCGFKLHHMPFATLAVNMVACFIIGICYAYFQSKTSIPPHIKLALTCGFCGGLSTLSALALEVVLIQESFPITAIVYAILSVVLSVVAVLLGIGLGRMF
ncbi:MAG: fluoride efflux transporter CrcB [Cyanobacteria bacterium SIG29]|nr:fluoride efflux transporter CrcB [Cyanobacteria bacterium SIG29]